MMDDEDYHIQSIADHLRDKFGKDKVHDKALEKNLMVRRSDDPCVIYAIFLVNNGVKIINKGGKQVLEGVKIVSGKGHSGQASPRSMSPERRASPVRRLPGSPPAGSNRNVSPTRAPAYAGGCASGCSLGTAYRSMSPPKYSAGHAGRSEYSAGHNRKEYSGGWEKDDDYSGGHGKKYSGGHHTEPARKLY